MIFSIGSVGMDNIDFALQVMIFGFVLVMFTLFLLYLVIILLGKFFGLRTTYDSEITDIEEGDLEEKWGVEGVSTEKVAAIVAAINTYLLEPSAYTIKKIEPVSKKQTTDKWALQGRKELLNMQEEIDKIRREKSGKKIF